MGQRVKLRAISDSIPNTGVFGPKGEYPVGTIFTLPDDVPFIGSGYERHELLDAEKTEAHEPVTNPISVSDGSVVIEGDGDVTVNGSLSTSPAYTATPTDSPGWWVITDQDGNEIKKVRPADGAAFNDLDDAGKAAEVAKLTA